MATEDWRIVADRLRDQLDSLAVREEQERRNAIRFGDTNYPGGYAGDWPDFDDMPRTDKPLTDKPSTDTPLTDMPSKEFD